jgi:hypothetical protein
MNRYSIGYFDALEENGFPQTRTGASMGSDSGEVARMKPYR